MISSVKLFEYLKKYKSFFGKSLFIISLENNFLEKIDHFMKFMLTFYNGNLLVEGHLSSSIFISLVFYK
jgi:hypothetical protein